MKNFNLFKACSCNLIGTTGNLGCDKITGLCSCKAFVAGRACDQCAVCCVEFFKNEQKIIVIIF